jgi:hypothetical protein
MEQVNNKPSFFAYALQYGLYLGIGLIALEYIYHAMNVPMKDNIRYISTILLFAGVVFLGLNYRNQHAGGYMNYSKAFFLTFLLSLFPFVLQSLNSYIMMRFLYPDMLVGLIVEAEQQMIMTKPDISDEELELAMKVTEIMFTPVVYVLIAFLGSAFVSVIMSLIAALFVRKSDPNAVPF